MIQDQVKDAFTQDELIAIYTEAGSAEQDALTAAALRLFPERMKSDAPPMLKAETGLHGRWFCLGEDREDVQAPVCTIKSGRCSWVGILSDGSAHKY